MNNRISNIVTLLTHIKSNSTIDVQVEGTSMEPTMVSGDIVSIQPQDVYLPGDIIVFTYKNDCLLIHRLLKIENDRYFCKGDNSFRLEDISVDQILGKAIRSNGLPIQRWNNELINLSYLVNRTFRNYGYNSDKTKESGIYRFYQRYVNRQGYAGMIFKVTPKLECLIDSSCGWTANSHVNEGCILDKKHLSFFECLLKTCEFNNLITVLNKQYDGNSSDISEMLEGYLVEAILKHWVDVF